jgi:hypothetical protein
VVPGEAPFVANDSGRSFLLQIGFINNKTLRFRWCKEALYVRFDSRHSFFIGGLFRPHTFRP